MAKIQIPSPRNSYITRYSGSVSSEIATYEYSKIQERIKITNNGAGLLGVWVEGKSKKLQRGETCEFEGDITEFSVKSIGGKTEFYAKASQSSALRKIFEGEPVVAVNLESEEYILSGHKIIGESPNIRLGTSTSSYVCICPFKANTDYTIFFNRLPLTG